MEFPNGQVAGASLDLVNSSPGVVARRRRRIMVFLGVFALVSAIGLIYTYSRRAEYRAGVRMEIVIPPQAEVKGPTGELTRASFLAEVERLSSRPVLEHVVARAGGASAISSAADPSPVDSILKMLSVQTVEGTSVVQLWAIGARPAALPAVLNALVDVYGDDLQQRSRIDTGESVALAEEEAKRLEESVKAKREAFKNFAAQHQIVSLERDENEVLARVRGQTAALSTSQEKLATAEGKLKSLQDAAAAGSVPITTKNNPTLANLEQRASQIREELRNLERVYKNDYLALDPGVNNKRVALAELEAQIRAERQVSFASALAEAEQEVGSARATIDRLRQEISASRGQVQAFDARIAEYKSMSDELTGLEKLYRTASERALTLKTSDRVRAPSVKVLESAVEPRDPWRPPYSRDAAISVGIGLLAALIALLIYDYLTPREKVSTLLMAGAPMAIPMITVNQPPQLAVGAGPQIRGPQVELLPSAPTFPREVHDEEIRALLGAADRDTRLAVAVLLSGVSADEACALCWCDLNLESGIMRVRGVSQRELPINARVRAFLSEARERLTPAPEAPLIRLQSGESSERRNRLDIALACAAHDAMVPEAETVTAEALRHSYLAFLVRQGIRFADIGRIAGELPSQALKAYMGLAPSHMRLALEQLRLTMPALEEETPGKLPPDRTSPS
jgi:uncharacterized protein involved in exopolysaccharide biosynthesis